MRTSRLFRLTTWVHSRMWDRELRRHRCDVTGCGIAAVATVNIRFQSGERQLMWVCQTHLHSQRELTLGMLR